MKYSDLSKMFLFLSAGILLIAIACSSSKKQRYSKPAESKQVYITLTEFSQKYPSGPCGNPASFEGQTVFIKGMVDYMNVYHNVTYSYNKFFIKESPVSGILEVKVIGRYNEEIFAKIQDNKEKKNCFLKAIIEGFDAPGNGVCFRMYVLKLENPSDISFE